MENFEGYKTCPDLKSEECCFVVEQYETGSFDQVEHVHVSKSRISKDARRTALRCLVARYWGRSGMNAETIVHSLLNGRGKTPPRYELSWHTSYPEPGVVRQYYGANTKAWFDEVIDPAAFRPKIEES